MTDARMPERWLNDRRILRLTPPAFRAFSFALIWSVSNRTDGVIEKPDLDLIPGLTSAHILEFLAEGLWVREDESYFMTEFEQTQTTRAELEALDEKRLKAREKKRRQRAMSPDPSRGTSRGAVQARTGQARTGKAASTEPSLQRDMDRDAGTYEPEWNVVQIPSGEPRSRG